MTRKQKVAIDTLEQTVTCLALLSYICELPVLLILVLQILPVRIKKKLKFHSTRTSIQYDNIIRLDVILCEIEKHCVIYYAATKVANLKTVVAAGKVDGDNMTFIHSEHELRIRGRLSEMHAEFSAANKATRDHISGPFSFLSYACFFGRFFTHSHYLLAHLSRSSLSFFVFVFTAPIYRVFSFVCFCFCS